MSEPKQCPICDAEDWEDLDHLRSHKYWYDVGQRYKEPVGFRICKECGFATYNYIDDIEESYDKQRVMVAAENIVTGNRKKRYHAQFLDEYIKPDMSALDIGAATGYYLKWLHDDYGLKTENLHGTEFSKAFRSFAKNEYRLTVTENEIPDGTYDLISYYHVLEHIQHPDRELERIKKHMHKDSLLYISVPYWFGSLEEFSGPLAVDWEHVWHLNHIDAWSEEGFRNLLRKAGLEIIKEDKIIYGMTVLCKLGKVEPIVKEDYKRHIEIMELQKKAIDCLNKKEYDKAIEHWPQFPDAWIANAMQQSKMKDFPAQLETLEAGMVATGGHQKLLDHIATVLMQWHESTGEGISNNLRRAEEMFLESIGRKRTEQILFFIGILYGKHLNQPEKAVEYLKEVLAINPGRFGEVQNFIGKFRCADG